jgi:hypothetical protein
LCENAKPAIKGKKQQSSFFISKQKALLLPIVESALRLDSEVIGEKT